MRPAALASLIVGKTSGYVIKACLRLQAQLCHRCESRTRYQNAAKEKELPEEQRRSCCVCGRTNAVQWLEVAGQRYCTTCNYEKEDTDHVLSSLTRVLSDIKAGRLLGCKEGQTRVCMFGCPTTSNSLEWDITPVGTYWVRSPGV